MQYLVCYDVSDDRRRDRLAVALLDFGRRIQESVFWMTLDGDLYRRMIDRIEKLLSADDTLHVVPVCEACAKRVVLMGRAEAEPDPDFYIV